MVLIAALVLAFATAWFVVGFLPIVPTDLDIFFWPSAQAALAGHPLAAYSQSPIDQYPNVNQNGPLSLVPLTAIGLVVRGLGWMDSLHLRRALTLAFFSLFIVVMAREGVLAIERLRGRRLDRRARMMAYAALAAGPPIWQSLAGYGHIEQPFELWFLMLATRWLDRGWAARSGLALGLAVLSRSIAGLAALPLGIYAWRRGPQVTAVTLLVAAGAAVAGLLPFYLADPASLMQSLFTNRGLLSVGAGSIWSLTTGTALEPVAQHDDLLFVAALAVVANGWLAMRPGGLTQQRLFAAMTVTSACIVVAGKSVWPYYLMEPYVFATVWSIGTWQAERGITMRVAVPSAFVVLGLLAERGATPHLAVGAVRAEGLAMFAALGALLVFIIRSADGADQGMRRSSISQT